MHNDLSVNVPLLFPPYFFPGRPDEEDSPFKYHISPSTAPCGYRSRILYMSGNFANPDEFLLF